MEHVFSVRTLIGASLLGDADFCIFITTVDHFSKPAQEAIKRVLNSFELIDYNNFINMLQL
ncbi:MAG: restriction endonuclease [Blautia producta]